ncbi:MAG: lytic transglycosylase domain-containing protein [Thermodesulfobacteria bacterium]|nr:lytic transglycosylase domain-containing protein [Thermodesulfobacteriota bacterium]
MHKKLFLCLIGLLCFIGIAIAASITSSPDIYLQQTLSYENETFETFQELPPEVIKNLPPDINAQVAYFIRYYTTSGKKGLQKWFDRCGPYFPYFKAIFKEFGIPEDLIYLAVIESGCSPFAVSHAGAVGIWQFIRGTARKYGLKINYWVDERKDFIKSTYAAARYLKRLYEIFGDWREAVASYNLGEAKLMRILRARNFVDYWQLMRTRRLPLETIAYLPQWMAVTLIAKNPRRYGFKPIKEKPFNFETIEVNGGVDLRVFAIAGNIDYKLLLTLNAELRRRITPPGRTYLLRIPYGKKQEILKNLQRLRLIIIKRRFHRKIYRITTALVEY